MKLESILLEWDKDSIIDKTNLSEESLKIPHLHSKYLRIFSNESLMLHKMKQDIKKLRLEKYEFYTQGPTKETQEKGWQLPAQGRILKNEVQQYIDVDDDITSTTLKMSIQSEKVKALEMIINQINNRSFIIKDAIAWQQFINGG